MKDPKNIRKNLLTVLAVLCALALGIAVGARCCSPRTSICRRTGRRSRTPTPSPMRRTPASPAERAAP